MSEDNRKIDGRAIRKGMALANFYSRLEHRSPDPRQTPTPDARSVQRGF